MKTGIIILISIVACLLPYKVVASSETFGIGQDATILSPAQQTLAEQLKSQARSTELDAEARRQLRSLYHSDDSSDRQVAEAVLEELAHDEDHRLAGSAILLLGSRSSDWAKACLIEILTGDEPDLRVRAASDMLRRQQLTQDEAMMLLEASKGLDERVWGRPPMHGPALESRLIRVLAASQGPTFFPVIKAHIESSEATLGIHEGRHYAFAATDAPEARRILFEELRESNLRIASRGIALTVALRETLVRGVEAGDRESKELLHELVAFLKSAVLLPDTDPQVKESAFLSLAMLTVQAEDSVEPGLRQFVIDHEERWTRSRTQIESWLRRGEVLVPEADVLVPRADRPNLESFTGDRQALAQELLSGILTAELQTEGGSRILRLYQSQDAGDVEVAEAVLWKLVGHEDVATAASAVARLGSRPNSRLKSFVVELLEQGDRELVIREAIAALGAQDLSDAEVGRLFDLAKGLDARVLEESITRGTQLESALLTSLASNHKKAFFPMLQQYLDSPDVTPGLYIPGILSAVDAPESRRMLLNNFKAMDLASNGWPISTISALSGTIARGINSEDPADRAIREEYIAFLKSAVHSPSASTEVKEHALFSLTMLMARGADTGELQLWQFVTEQSELWKGTPRAEVIEGWLNWQREASFGED